MNPIQTESDLASAIAILAAWRTRLKVGGSKGGKATGKRKKRSKAHYAACLAKGRAAWKMQRLAGREIIAPVALPLL